MDNQWAVLPAAKSNLQSLPQLLVRCSFKSDSYSVFLTDLTRVWSETLTRREIIKRALNENTSIDPTEDNTQLRVLLDTIKAPLFGHDGVLELAKASYSTILLRATARLPPPLDSLSWTYRLTLASESSLKHELIAPMWVLAYKQQQEIRDLLRYLREKDHVISKLLDSVESSNTDLATIFPSTAGMKTVKDTSRREQAMQHVPGLGAFDEGTWQEEFKKKEARFRDALSSSVALTQANASVFESLCSRSEPVTHSAEWWDDLGNLPAEIPDVADSTPSVRDEEKPLLAEQPNRPVDDDETESEEDEYQKQPTPPHLRAQKSPDPVRSSEPSRSSSIAYNERPTERQLPKSPAKKLGRIGGRPKTPQPVSERSTSQNPVTSNVEAPPIPSIEYQSKGPVRKLGRIGGKSDKEMTADTLSYSHLQNGRYSETVSDRSTPRKEDLPHRNADSSVGKAPSAVVGSKRAEPSPVREENTEELANRKREELRRQLQAQEQAPVKKKRRF